MMWDCWRESGGSAASATAKSTAVAVATPAKSHITRRVRHAGVHRHGHRAHHHAGWGWTTIVCVAVPGGLLESLLPSFRPEHFREIMALPEPSIIGTFAGAVVALMILRRQG